MTSKVQDLKAKYGYGAQEQQLPGWEKDVPFVCRLRRPQLTNMAEIAGFIPNPLLGTIDEMFFPTPGKKQAQASPEQRSKIMRLMAKYALVEPTLDELDQAGVELTDEQYAAIYLYALGGLDTLSRFRPAQRGLAGNDGSAVPRPAVEPGGD